MEPLIAGRCPHPDACVGVSTADDSSAGCVCYRRWPTGGDAQPAATASVKTDDDATPQPPSIPRWRRDPPENKSLFIDGGLFAALEGDLGLVRHRSTPVGAVLTPTEPWESFGIVAYHSVVVAGPGDYRLYYDTGWTMPDRTDWVRYTCLATSTDGVHWTKPHLGVATFCNNYNVTANDCSNTSNNIVWPRDWRDNTHAAGTVFVDTNPAAPADAKFKMVAQWNIGAVHPRGMQDAGVYVMKSPDGVRFTNMFGNRSLDWSDTKNVMFWSHELDKYVAYVRIDNYLPDPHINDTCTLGFRPGRRVGRCLIGADQLHDWSLAGCTSHADGGGLGDTECSVGRSCARWGKNYSAIRCDPERAPDRCKQYGTCGNVTSSCSATGVCTVESGPEPGPLCGRPSLKGTATVLSFDEEDPSCLDIYTSSATPYDNSGVVLFFPSAYQHFELTGGASKNNDGLVDVRFATARRILDDARYPPTRNGRAPFVPLGVNLCAELVLASGAPRFDWCYNGAFATNGSSVNTGTVYMATGYVKSADGAQLSLYSGGTPQSHGGGGLPPTPAPGGKRIGHEGFMGQHSAVLRHVIRTDGFVGLEAGYGGANSNQEEWPQMLTVPLRVPRASLCASEDVELRANLISGVGGGAYFAIEQHGAAVPNFTVHDSVLIAGDWIDARVGWGGDTGFETRVLTRFSEQDVQIRVAMRDAELFSLSMGCVQRARYPNCWRAPGCEFWGAGYRTIPCWTDEECRQFGTCSNVLPRCSIKFGNQSHGERVCATESGGEQGPLCGWF